MAQFGQVRWHSTGARIGPVLCPFFNLYDDIQPLSGRIWPDSRPRVELPESVHHETRGTCATRLRQSRTATPATLRDAITTGAQESDCAICHAERIIATHCRTRPTSRVRSGCPEQRRGPSAGWPRSCRPTCLNASCAGLSTGSRCRGSMDLGCPERILSIRLRSRDTRGACPVLPPSQLGFLEHSVLFQFCRCRFYHWVRPCFLG